MSYQSAEMMPALVLATVLLALCNPASAGSTEGRTRPRPASWAQPVDMPGLPNLHRVSTGLFRGAQPEPQGFRSLVKMGIKTVVNLRQLHSDRDEMDEAGVADDLDYVHIRFNPFHPEDEDVVEFLKVIADPAKRPVFVHCRHGADRTGMMVAIYRIVFQGWTKKQAIEEMTTGGFGFHGIWKNLVRYVRKVDVEVLRRKAGL
ncbi:MAG: protein-tyrosine-phosphatase, partial [Deltaproteobacteria bacterium]